MESHVIGISPARKDAWGKVSGEALYVNDVKLPVCLEGKVLRSPYPHARIAGIDVGKAKKLPGVAAVITGQDLPAKRFGNSIADQPVLARRRVRFVGERVAAVAAVDADTAAEALELIIALSLGRTGMAALALIREWKEIAADRPSLWRKEMVAAAWVVLLLALVWLLGFIPAIPLFMILALRLRAHEPWRLTLFLTLGVWLFMYGLFVWALNVQFEYGYLVNLFLS